MLYQLEEDNSGNAPWVGEAMVSKTGHVGVGQLPERSSMLQVQSRAQAYRIYKTHKDTLSEFLKDSRGQHEYACGVSKHFL